MLAPLAPLAAGVKAKLLRKIAREKEAYKIVDAFDELEWDQRGAAVAELLRGGELDLIKNPGLWDLLPKAAAVLTAADLLAFLGKVDKLPRDSIYPHLPFWPRELDEVVMAVACRPEERAALVAGCASLPNKKMRSGLAWCLVRFGEDTRGLIGDQSAELAKLYRIHESVLWPQPWAGGIAPLRRDIWDPHANVHTELFTEVLGLLGDPVKHAKASLKRIVASIKKGGAKNTYDNWDLDHIRPALALASDAELVGIFHLTSSSRAAIERTIAAMPRFTPALIAALATELGALGARNEVVLPLVQCGIARSVAAGEAPPQALLDAVVLDASAEREATRAIEGWLAETARALYSVNDRATFDRVVRLDLASPYPALAPALHAFAGLDPTQVEAIVARSIAQPSAVATYLTFVRDEALIDRVIAHASRFEGPEMAIAYGLGFVAPSVLPRLAAAFDAATHPVVRAKLGFAATMVLARLGEAGQPWPEQYDRLIGPHPHTSLEDSSYGSEYMLRKAIQHLPLARARPVLLRLLGELTRPIDLGLLSWGVAPHADDPAIQEAFVARLLVDEADIKRNAASTLTGGLRAFADAGPVIRAVLSRGGGLYLAKIFAEVYGEPRYAQLVTESNAGGGAAASDDPIDRAVAIAASLKVAADETVLALRVLDLPPTSFARVGGLPPGIDAAAWPRHDDAPMVHLFTLDFTGTAAIARTMSVFCARPELNEASEPGTAWTAVIWRTAAEASRPGEAPEGLTPRPAKGLEAVAIAVPANVWTERSGAVGRLRDALYALPARVFGRPQWLQGPEDDDDDDGFIMQFDADFVSINLGDSGIMYVFEETAFWQCH